MCRHSRPYAMQHQHGRRIRSCRDVWKRARGVGNGGRRRGHEPRPDWAGTVFSLIPSHVPSAKRSGTPQQSSPVAPLRHPAVRARSEEPRHWPEHGRTHRGHGENLEYRPSRARCPCATESSSRCCRPGPRVLRRSDRARGRNLQRPFSTPRYVNGKTCRIEAGCSIGPAEREPSRPATARR